jgi:23S rRNA (cytidine2498-2'-O)-methyltransferase
MIGAAYLAPPDLEATLAEELRRADVPVTAWHGRLALSPAPPVASVPAPSVKAAADALRGLQRNWSAYGAAHHRRMALIAERLPPVKAPPLTFPATAPSAHLGAWTLLAPDTLLASPTKTSPFVNGECQFVEDHIGPPSRAYLKLWDAFVQLGEWPRAGQTCLDLGAAPGGWSWAAAMLGAEVISVDKAPLDARMAALPNVTWRDGSAFAEPPAPVDWLLSDVIAYPDRLLALVRRWIDAGAAGRIVCTVKFQGETDHGAAAAFAAIPGGRLRHLFHNKHELTFMWRRPP